jgi:hypothetical protein
MLYFDLMVSDSGALEAKQEITEIIYKYCRAVDRMDRQLALSVWHQDGTADWGEMYQGSGSGFIDWVWNAHAEFERHSHQISNILIQVDGDHAVSESYVTVALWARPDALRVVEMVGRGRYADRWSRRGGRWAIDHRRYISDLQTSLEIPAENAMEGVEGRRDRSDPSYAVFPFRAQVGS